MHRRLRKSSIMKPPLDKIAHALACYGAVLTFALVMPLVWAVMITMMVGALKEWHDYVNPLTNTAEWDDFWANCVGAGLAVAVVLGLGLVA